MRKFLLLILFSQVCNAEIINSVISCGNGLDIESSVNPVVVDFGFFEDFRIFETFPHIQGTLKVSNRTKNDLYFSTSYYYMEANDVEKTRAYHRSIASHLIDVPPGEIIRPGDNIVLSVYWASSKKLGDTIIGAKQQCIVESN